MLNKTLTVCTLLEVTECSFTTCLICGALRADTKVWKRKYLSAVLSYLVSSDYPQVPKVRAKLAIHVSSLTYGQELWEVTERMRMSGRMAVLSPRNGMKSLNIQRDLGGEVLLLCIQRS